MYSVVQRMSHALLTDNLLDGRAVRERTISEVAASVNNAAASVA